MKKTLDLARLGEYRWQRRLNQTDFWSRFGITQSGGSRYEAGHPISRPVALLIQLWHSGEITDAQLDKAARALGWSKPKTTKYKLIVPRKPTKR
jgi:hypothetical protein